MVLVNAGGSFDASQTYPLPGGDSSPVSLTAGDFDGDGTVDLAVAAGDNDRLHVFKNGGSSFAPATQLDVPYVVRFVTSSDLNRDGRPDLIAIADGLLYLRGRGGLDFDPPQTVVARYKPSAAVVADFDRDGRNDVVVLDEDSDEISILRSTACQQQRLEVSVQPNACSTGAPPFPFDAAVTAFDDGGNVAVCASGNVTRSIVPGTGDPSAVLGGPTSLAFSAGVAAFTGANSLTLDKPGRYKLAFQTPGPPPVQSRSFTLGQPAPLQILGPDSVCPAGSGTYTLNQSFDTYAWTLTPPGGSPSLFTPAVILSGPPLSGAYQLGVVGRNECVASASRNIFFGNLASVSLNVTGVSSVCVDCIGGSAKAVELGGGAIASRQWGYRILSGGAITSLPGEAGRQLRAEGRELPRPRHVLRGRDVDSDLRHRHDLRGMDGERRRERADGRGPAPRGLVARHERERGQPAAVGERDGRGRGDPDPLGPGAGGHEQLPAACQRHGAVRRRGGHRHSLGRDA